MADRKVTIELLRKITEEVREKGDSVVSCAKLSEALNDALEMLEEPIEVKKYPPTRYSDTLYGCGCCGHELAKNAKFCYDCGAPIKWG